MSEIKIKTIPTAPFDDQKPGTSGLRKKVTVIDQPNYIENFVQAIFNTVERNEAGLLVLGGDGRYRNRDVIAKVIAMAVANGIRRIVLGAGGILSTPAASNLIRKEGAFGGIVLSASHNPGGPDGDFGIKFNSANGGPAPQAVTDAIHSETRRLTEYRIAEIPNTDVDETGSKMLGEMRVDVIDPVSDYANMLEGLFDFGAIRKLFGGGFSMCFDAMHAVTGPYAREILEARLQAGEGTVINGVPREDFGGGHPDPNPIHAASLFKRMMGNNAPDFGAASDGDGDRNLILGKGIFVSPSDSLAILAANAHLAPGYSGGLAGIARSMPTSAAADMVADRLGIPLFETPTGWKFFGNLLDAGKVSICGEESAGTGSDHVREKDGLWAVLFWLNILAVRRESVAEIVEAHWRAYGRHYYSRWDYEGIEPEIADRIYSRLRGMAQDGAVGTAYSRHIEKADEFSYDDPVDGSTTKGQGLRFFFHDGCRIVYRLSGTGTVGATLRIYLERFEPARGDIAMANGEALKDLARIAVEMADIVNSAGISAPTVIT